MDFFYQHSENIFCYEYRNGRFTKVKNQDPMIFEALNFISKKINGTPFFVDHAFKSVRLGDVSVLHDSKQEMHVLLTLTNVEEEVLLRSPDNYLRRGDSVLYKKPPIFLNLSILFGAYHYDPLSDTADGYEDSLKAIQHIIGFFQAQSVFDQASSPELQAAGIEKLTFELINMNMEQLHHLWAMLGGKYLPSVAYKMRMVMIDEAKESPAPLISQIVLDDKVIV